MDSAKPIYKYLEKQNSQLVDLITHGRTINTVSTRIKSHINQQITGDWRIGGLSRYNIQFIVSTAESAHRLRFHSANILKHLRTLEFCELLNKIEIKIRPEDFKSGEKPENRKNSFLSTQGQKHVNTFASTVEDQALKASLQRLAKHLAP